MHVNLPSLSGLLTLGAVLFSTTAEAAPHWITWDSTVPAGTPPTIVLDPASNEYKTILDVRIHGMWVDPVAEGTTTFQKLRLDAEPGDAPFKVNGRPDLPVIPLQLANLLDATEGTVDFTSQSMQIVAGILPYPVQPNAIDNGDPPPPFEYDEEFYQLTTSPYPMTNASDFLPNGRYAGVPMADVVVQPLQLIPAIGELWIHDQFRVEIQHVGTGGAVPIQTSRRQLRTFEFAVDNLPAIDDWLVAPTIEYKGEFLFVTPEEFLEEIEPLVQQKKNRGYKVDIYTTEQTGTTCEEIKASIITWWAWGEEGADRYCILVGDTQFIPMCEDEFGNNSDMMYACLDGVGIDGWPDPNPEIHLGRFPADDEAEVSHMVDKTLTYEGGYPFSGQWLDNVLLAAHEQDYPGKYTQAQEDVRTAFYLVQPDFTTAYGGAGATNADVVNEIEDGMNVVCYRGHGSTSTWWDWNIFGDYLETSDVTGLENSNKYPVVFSIACANNNINGTSIGERWLTADHGAVAHYGAANSSYTTPNHTLDRWLFRAIYKCGMTILGDAMALAESRMMLDHGAGGEENAWMYSLLGDPELKVWREAPQEFEIAGIPPEVPPGPSELVLTILDGGGEPVPDLLVAVPLHGNDGEFGGGFYTERDGTVRIPIHGSYFVEDGQIPLTAYSEFEDYEFEEKVIPVDASSDVSENADERHTFRLDLAGPNPFQAATTLRYSIPESGSVELFVVDSQGREVARPFSGQQDAGEHTVVFRGEGGDGTKLGSGVYWSVLQFGERRETEKLVLQK